MQVPKSGKISHMVPRVTCGHLDVFYMRWLHFDLPLQLEICLDFTKKCVQEFSIEFHINTLTIYKPLSVPF